MVVVAKDTADGGFLLTEGHHVYGRAVLAWIRDHYEPVRALGGQLGLTILRRRP